MTLPINQIICGDNVKTMATFPDDCIDLTVTSPPYGELRKYGSNGDAASLWDFEGVAQQLWRVTKPGGVVVWVVADQTIDGSESGESFRQALRFKEIGFRLHDTMIYHRQGQNPSSTRYWQNFEYMFILSKGSPVAINLLKDRKNKYRKMGGDLVRQADGTKKAGNRGGRAMDEFGYRENIWYYSVGGGNIGEGIGDHSAAFPEQLAVDHILSWSNPGHIVLDPFAGSGTTPRKAKDTGRKWIAIELNPDYVEIIRNRMAQQVFEFP